MKKVVSFAELNYLVNGDGKSMPIGDVIGKIIMSTRTKTEKVLAFLITLSETLAKSQEEINKNLIPKFKEVLSKYGTSEEIENGKLSKDSPNSEAFEKEWNVIHSEALETKVEVDFNIDKEFFDKEKLSAEQLNVVDILFR